MKLHELEPALLAYRKLYQLLDFPTRESQKVKKNLEMVLNNQYLSVLL